MSSTFTRHLPAAGTSIGYGIPCRSILAIFVVLLLGSPVASVAQACPPVPPPKAEQIAKAVMPPGTELAHPPVSVSLPSSYCSLVVLFRPADDVNTNFQGFVVVIGASSSTEHKYALPPMDEIPGRFDIQVLSVFRALAATKPVLVVLYQYHRNGSETDSGFASYVYGWSGQEYTKLHDLASKVVGLETAAAVRKKLLNAP